MNNDMWFDVADEIIDTVSNALDSKVFDNLSKNISNSLDAVSKKLEGTSNNLNSGVSIDNQSELAGAVNNIKVDDLYVDGVPGNISALISIVLGIIGIIFAVGGLITFLVLFILSLALSGGAGIAGMAITFLLLTIVLAILLGVAISAIVKGVNRKVINKRLGRYKQNIGTKGYIELDKLAVLMRLPVEKVKKDIKYMIAKGYFIEGHLDKNEHILITMNSVYKDYLRLERKQKRDAIKQKAKNIFSQDGGNNLSGAEEALQTTMDKTSQNSGAYYQEEDLSQYTPEVQAILKQGNEYIRKVREANDAIANEAMTQKLSDMEDIMHRIFDRVKSEPDSISELNKFMRYYLPTTVKLLEAYVAMEGHPTYSESNIETTRKEIENSIDVINVAFEKLLDSMFDDVALDISTDISTMKMMMETDGLAEENF